MGGGLMQLVAYGAQDIYLTGNPQITFFKVVYRRHTNFSMEAIDQTWSGASTNLTASRCTATISRNGDLVHRMYLELDGTVATNMPNVAAQSIVSLEIEIGGQKIDKHTGQWMNVWAHLTEPNPTGHTGEVTGSKSLGTLFQNMSCMGGSDTKATDAVKTFVPLQFWFCRNPGLALPLIALQYHEVKVIFNYNFGAVAGSTPYTAITNNTLWCDYIYLDTDERRRFAQVSHEYLIEQVQEQSIVAATNASLNFNHPVKELIWCVNSAAGLLTTIGSSTATYQLKLNGHDRFAKRDWRYFSRTQVWQHLGELGRRRIYRRWLG